jgi:hypothetical protein
MFHLAGLRALSTSELYELLEGGLALLCSVGGHKLRKAESQWLQSLS